MKDDFVFTARKVTVVFHFLWTRSTIHPDARTSSRAMRASAAARVPRTCHACASRGRAASTKDAKRAMAGQRRAREDAVAVVDVLKGSTTADDSGDDELDAVVVNPATVARLARYAEWGDGGVKGFFEPGLCALYASLDAFHVRNGVKGSLAEIGVYHGKSFAPLALMRRDDERCVAVDCFDAQEHNVDDSGAGDRAAFERNVACAMRACREDDDDDEDEDGSDGSDGTDPAWLRVVEADSATTPPETLTRAADGQTLRIFSIDGCHTESHTAADVETASRTLHDLGVVVVDDAFNPDWPGVVAGLFRWTERNRNRNRNGGDASTAPPLVPFAIGYNKVLMCRPDAHDALLTHVKTSRETRASVRKTAEFLGGEVVVLPHGWISTFHGNERLSSSN